MSDTELPRPDGQQDNKVSYLDQALWGRLVAATEVDQFASAWFGLQVAMLPGARRGIIVARVNQGYQPVAHWPEDQAIARELAKTAERALTEQKGVVQKSPDNPQLSQIAYPVLVNQQVEFVVVLEVEQGGDLQLRSAMRQIQWGAAWFEVFHRKSLPLQITEQKEILRAVVQFVATVLDRPNFKAAVNALATELATHFECERVSIGLLHKNHIQVEAISHSAQFDKKTNLVSQIGLAMDEAREQLSDVVFPGTVPHLISQSHQSLVKAGDTGSACTVLLATDDKVFGAMTFEHREQDFFTTSRLSACHQIALLVGPIVDLKRKDDRLLLAKIVDSAKASVAALVGPDFLLVKTVLATISLLLILTSLISVDHRVSADATLEGAVQRHISAPVDGYIASAQVRAGDVVKAGDPLFSLDDRDMRLEKLKWSSQRIQVEQKYHEALSKHDKAEASIQKAQLDQADAQIELIDSQLARINATAPFDGIVVSGDLSQTLGAPVRKGDTLLKIAPLDGYRVILKVDEMDISFVAEGQAGVLSLASLPGERFELNVEKITPASSPAEGRNVFRVEAALTEPTENLRPGMQGTGKVIAGKRSLLWIWTHNFFDWFRVWSWTWWP